MCHVEFLKMVIPLKKSQTEQNLRLSDTSRFNKDINSVLTVGSTDL